MHHKQIPTPPKQKIVIKKNNIAISIAGKVSRCIDASMNRTTPTVRCVSRAVERPNLGCRTLVYRHFSKIVVGIVNDLCDWVVATRVKASALLYTLLLHEEENVTQHLPRVLGGLYRAAGDEEAAVAGYVSDRRWGEGVRGGTRP